MKKMLAILLTLLLVGSVTVTALAATGGTTKLTATVPDTASSWNLVVPADKTIPYNQTSTYVGSIKATDLKNMTGKTIYVGLSYTPLENGAETIPLQITYNVSGQGSAPWTADKKPYVYSNDGSSQTIPMFQVYALVTAADWAAAQPGTYTATLTFTSYCEDTP